MKRTKKMTVIAIILICIFILGACGEGAMANTFYSFSTTRSCKVGQNNITILTDDETGIQYILVYSQYTDEYGTVRQEGVAITPRLGSNGKFCVEMRMR